MKYNKIFRVLFIGVIVCLLVTAIPATPALAQQTIVLTPAFGTAGTTVSVTGYTAAHIGQPVYILFNYNYVSDGISTFTT